MLHAKTNTSALAFLFALATSMSVAQVNGGVAGLDAGVSGGTSGLISGGGSATSNLDVRASISTKSQESNERSQSNERAKSNAKVDARASAEADPKPRMKKTKKNRSFDKEAGFKSFGSRNRVKIRD